MSRVTKKWCVALAALFAAFAIAACGGSDSKSDSDGGSGDTTQASEGGAKGKHVVLVTCGAANPFCNVANQAIVDNLKAAGVKVDVLEDDFDAAVQVRNFENAIAQKPDLIINWATDAKSVVPSTKRANDAGIPVMNIDGRADDAAVPYLATQVLADNEALGRFAAENCIEGIEARGDKGGKIIAITGTKGTNIVEDRLTGFNEVLAENPDYELIEQQDGNWDPNLSAKLAQQLFAKYGGVKGIDCVYGMADYQAAAIVQAAKQANIPLGVENDGLIITGSNCFKVGIEAIDRGDMYGTATQSPEPEGTKVAEVAIDFLNGEEVEPINIVEEFRITKDTIEDHREECTF
jgi:ABC-type sugar transport system substrate-binding protein